jgi:hypothetical protein
VKQGVGDTPTTRIVNTRYNGNDATSIPTDNTGDPVVVSRLDMLIAAVKDSATRIVEGMAKLTAGTATSADAKATAKAVASTEQLSNSMLAEIQNLRADEWTREGHLMTKLDDLWRSILDIKDYLGTSVISMLTQIRDRSGNQNGDPLVTAVEALPAESQGLGEVIVAALADLGNQLTLQMASDTSDIKRTIGDAVSALISGMKGGSSNYGDQMGTSLNQTFADLQFKIMDAKDRQQALLGQMSPSLAAQLQRGEVGTPITQGDSNMLREFNSLADIISDLTGEMNRLKGLGAGTTPTPAPKDIATTTTPTSTYTGAVSTKDTTLDTSALKPVTASVISDGTVSAIDSSGLYDMLDKHLAVLNENVAKILAALGGGASTLINGVKDGVTATSDVTQAVAVNTEVTRQAAVTMSVGLGALDSDIFKIVEQLPAVNPTGSFGTAADGGHSLIFGSDRLVELMRDFAAAGMSDDDVLRHFNDIGLTSIAETLERSGASLQQAVATLQLNGVSSVSDLKNYAETYGTNALIGVGIPTTGSGSVIPVNNYTRGGNTYTINVGSIRSQSDADYLVQQLNTYGVRA